MGECCSLFGLRLKKNAKVNALKVAKKYFVDFPGIKQNTFPGIVYFKLSFLRFITMEI